ncbi:hypothetical protein GLOIN_2v1587158 [Rhizophagus irregularis DAOM 181602=DAOM 197198]|uniref:Uncharacterized protein n=1 Tax=Rhizophagus irregularis (strain DAOM 181602 / DAOM 197198 / MUCL 43194) TaxID=747089 RepID=A0A2P4Q6W7_RHIID|nr:hypothetical protein GLOIN_2v1587158 [Rhizophagus irregularis DAOM 181602=DAOM 197198]POG73352.1 hypothetical protein GLOIN_2v1587158 [Rhizophagus irregularis DAOM 181602=DAOM 197198]GET65636.1 hypothetical protein GLOIN_2v1587158 [Rhizophagus irregularis DAOM 181602=DAOM 197198]|eukprot:XP_025180218.1 hypothetical protein GLOIN_2v1587158 [Rhizophagus irregularis DAOM 181602=DAOM 197198]
MIWLYFIAFPHYGIYISQTLWFEPARKFLSFATPPTADEENVYQSYFREKFLSQLEGDNYVKAVDRHSKKFLELLLQIMLMV